MTQNRRAVLISPAFFGYERDIVAEFERQGFATTFVDERPSNSSLARAVVRVRKSLAAVIIQTYYRRTLADLEDVEFDLVVVIKGEVVPLWFLEALRSARPSARFVFYAYDAIGNSSSCLRLLDLFDERLSFDRDDVAARTDFGYLPLFYTSDYYPLATPGERSHDLSFIGTLHSQRYSLARSMSAGLDAAFCFFFVQARWYFALTKYLTREHRTVPWSDVSFRPMNRAEIAGVFRDSKAVLDVQRAGQAGLTMRTFEVLASGSILVTTNDAITREPFYDPARIIVVPSTAAALNADNVHLDLATLAPPSAAPAGFEDYSLAAWVRRLAGETRD